MAFCTEPYGCVVGRLGRDVRGLRGFGRLGDVFTVAPGDCSVDAQSVTGLLWQIRNPTNPPIGGDVLPPAACYSTELDVALVKQVQAQAGLSPNGVVDDATLSALASTADASQPRSTGSSSPPKVTMDPLQINAKSSGAGGWLLAGAVGLLLLKKKRKG